MRTWLVRGTTFALWIRSSSLSTSSMASMGAEVYFRKALVRFDEETGGGLFADRLLALPDLDCELTGCGLHLAQLDLRPRDKALVVEPVQQLAVVLGEADDRCARTGLERSEWRELVVLGLLERGVDRP